VRGPVAGKLRLHPRLIEFLESPHALVRDASDLFESSLESREVLLQTIQRWSEPIAELAASIRKEEIAGKTADHCANQRSCHHRRSFVHTTSLYRPVVDVPKQVPPNTVALSRFLEAFLTERRLRHG
jgi:hypothetical protein